MKRKSVIIFLLAINLQLVLAYSSVVDESCLIRDKIFAGVQEGTYVDDMTQLKEIFTADTRMWGF